MCSRSHGLHGCGIVTRLACVFLPVVVVVAVAAAIFFIEGGPMLFCVPHDAMCWSMCYSITCVEYSFNDCFFSTFDCGTLLTILSISEFTQS